MTKRELKAENAALKERVERLVEALNSKEQARRDTEDNLRMQLMMVKGALSRLAYQGVYNGSVREAYEYYPSMIHMLLVNLERIEANHDPT